MLCLTVAGPTMPAIRAYDPSSGLGVVELPSTQDGSNWPGYCVISRQTLLYPM